MFTSLPPLPPSEIFGNPTWPPKDYVTILPINKSMFTITQCLQSHRNYGLFLEINFSSTLKCHNTNMSYFSIYNMATISLEMARSSVKEEIKNSLAYKGWPVIL